MEFLKQQAVVPAPTTPDDFAHFLAEDKAASRRLIDIVNAQPAEFKPAP